MQVRTKAWLIAMIALAVSAFPACSTCENEIVRETYSPGHRLKLVVFVRSCGATTGFSTQVSLLKASQARPTGGGNVLIADDNHGAAPTGAGNALALRAEWQSNEHAIITIPRNARVFRKASSQSGIQFSYKADD